MPTTLDQVFEEARNLSHSARIDLIDRLIEIADPDPELIAAQTQIAVKRSEEAESHPELVIRRSPTGRQNPAQG